MKTKRVIIEILSVIFIAGFLNLNAQTEHNYVPRYHGFWVECANDGLGEWVEGIIMVRQVEKLTDYYGFSTWSANAGGSYLVGETTGIKYRCAAVTIERWPTGSNNGAITYKWINRYHFVGKGTQYFLKENYVFVMKGDGEVIVDEYWWDEICK